jgi:hypothetical protein
VTLELGVAIAAVAVSAVALLVTVAAWKRVRVLRRGQQAILGYARVYVKELEHGQPNLALSPEEAEAVERAMAR